MTWHHEDISPKWCRVTKSTPARSLFVEVDNPYFMNGDLVNFPRTGDSAFVVDTSGNGVTLSSRHVRLVDKRVVGTKEVWNGDDWVEVDVIEDEPIPHWFVRNIRPRVGDDVLNIGATWRGIRTLPPI